MKSTVLVLPTWSNRVRNIVDVSTRCSSLLQGESGNQYEEYPFIATHKSSPNEQFTTETYLVYFKLNPDWVVGQAIGKLIRLFYRYGNHWSCNPWAVFRLHTAHTTGGRIWNDLRLNLKGLLPGQLQYREDSMFTTGHDQHACIYCTWQMGQYDKPRAMCMATVVYWTKLNPKKTY